MTSPPRIAVLVPCRNEAATVASVVADFSAALPNAPCTCTTTARVTAPRVAASGAGAIVRTEPRPGKGGVVRRMLGEIDADVYVIVDGDATYDAASAQRMVDELVVNDLDMVTAIRDEQGDGAAYRRGHRLGNRAFNALLGALFGARPGDMLSGYRVLSRRFAKSFPGRVARIRDRNRAHRPCARAAAADGGDPDALLRAARPGRRASFRRIATASRSSDDREAVPRREAAGVLWLFALAFGVVGLVLGGSVVIEYMETRLVPRFPTAILATGLMLLSSSRSAAA